MVTGTGFMPEHSHTLAHEDESSWIVLKIYTQGLILLLQGIATEVFRPKALNPKP